MYTLLSVFRGGSPLLKVASGGAEAYLRPTFLRVTSGATDSEVSDALVEIGLARGFHMKAEGARSSLDQRGLQLSEGTAKVAELYNSPGRHAALRIVKNDRTLAAVGLNELGAGALKISNPAGRTIAAVQGVADGSGTVDVFSLSGGLSAAGIGVGARGGFVVVRDKAGEQAAAMQLSSDATGGNLTLSKGGFGVFSAGAASDGGGEACLNRVTGGGKQRNVCLGVELPSMGLGK